VVNSLRAKECVSGNVVVWNGDNVGAVELGGLAERHRDAGAPTTLLIDDGGRVETVALAGWPTNLNTAADIERVNGRLDGA
jgi:hypothetical protein